MNKISNPKAFKKVGTHHGRFHADEVMATAILKEVFKIELTRTRDPKVLNELDIVYDVGGGEFDHHGIEKVYREDGIPYAACGLIWNKFGRDAIRLNEPSMTAVEIESVFDYVDRFLIEGIDAQDNGVRTGEEVIPTMSLSKIISGFNPPWHSEQSQDEAFDEAVEIGSIVLKNMIKHRLAVLKSKEIIEDAYKNRRTPEILVLDIFCPWEETLLVIDEKEEVMFVVYPDKDNYAMQTVRGENGQDRKYLPESWAGKEDWELVDATGVQDAVFCHTGRFIAVARSLEGIMRMAHLVIDEPEK